MTSWQVRPLPQVAIKNRLTQIQMRMLSLFTDNKITETESGLRSGRVSYLYSEIWPQDNLTFNTCEPNLKELVDCLFLTSGRVKLWGHYFTRYWLSESVQNGKLKHDENGWLIVNDKYLAPDKTRLKINAKEAKQKMKEAAA
jgi:hypothetical protein